MWMLSFVPTSIIYVVINIIFWTGLIGAIVSFLFRFQPLELYRTSIQICSIILLSVGLYAKGGYEVETQWRNRVAVLETKLKEATEASKKVNTVIQTRIVTETKYVRDIKVVNRDVIKQVEKIIDSKCEITPETINILNSAAQNEPAIRGNE